MPEKMLDQAGKGLLKVGNDVGQAFKDVYKKDGPGKPPQLLHDASWAADDVTKALVNGWKLSDKQAAVVLKEAKYPADAVADALKTTYNLSSTAVSDALKAANYTGDQISQGLQSAFTGISSATADALAGVASGLNTAVDETGKAITHAGKSIGHAITSIFG